MANFQGVFNYYPVSISGQECTKKENNEVIKTGMYSVLALALDNGLRTNKNGLYLTNSKSAHTTVNFKVPARFISKLSFMQPIKCLAELTPMNYDFFIKVLEIEIDGVFIPVSDEVE